LFIFVLFLDINRPLRESDILTPEQGRLVAKEIGCYYYEASAFTHYGVNEVFESVIRVALITRRQQRFWITNLRHIQHPLIQQPFCPPKPHPPKIHVLPSQFEAHFRDMLESQTFSDTLLLLNKFAFAAHKVILSASWPLVSSLLNQPAESTEPNCDLAKLSRSVSDRAISISADYSSGYFTVDTDNSNSSSKASENKSPSFKFQKRNPLKSIKWSSLNTSTNKASLQLKRRANSLNFDNLPIFKNHQPIINFKNPFIKLIDLKNETEDYRLHDDKKYTPHQVVLSVNDLISKNGLRQSLRFLYTGLIDPMDISLEKLLDAAQLLEINELSNILKHIESNQLPFHQYFGDDYQNEYIQKLKQRLKRVCLDQELYSGK